MAQTYNCHCNDCGRNFQARQGGGMSFIHLCCDGCGQVRAFPRFAPRPSRESVTIPRSFRPWSQYESREGVVEQDDGSLFVPGIPFEQIERWAEPDLREFFANPTGWSRSGDRWDDHEKAVLLDAMGHCECGGQWVEPENTPNKPHALHRCPNCQSFNYRYFMSDIISD